MSKTQCDACLSTEGKIVEKDGLNFCESCLFSIDSAKLIERDALLKWAFLTISDRIDCPEEETRSPN